MLDSCLTMHNGWLSWPGLGFATVLAVLAWTPVRPGQSIKSRQWVKKVKSMIDRVNQWRGTTVRYTSDNSGGHIRLNVVLILQIEAEHRDSQRQ